VHGIIGIHFVQATRISRERELLERIARPVPRSAPVAMSRVSRRHRRATFQRRALTTA
jgi:hypothetical protein